MFPNNETLCPITGLPLIHPPEWTNLNFGTDYYNVSFTLIGDSILLASTQGRSTGYTTNQAMAFREKIISDYIPASEKYIYIEDFSGLKSISMDTQNNYIKFNKKDDRLSGIIYFGASPLFKTLMRFAMIAFNFKFSIDIVGNYDDAIKLAISRSAGYNSVVKNPPFMVNDLPSVSPLENPEEPILEKCAYIGLPMTRREEWRHIFLKNDYFVTFTLYGDNIFLISPEGDCGNDGMGLLIQEFEKILKMQNFSTIKRVDIWDYSKIIGYPPKAARQQFVDFMVKENNSGRLLGYIALHVPFFLKVMISIAEKFYKPRYSIFVTADFRSAIDRGVKLLEIAHPGTQRKENIFTTKDDWKLRLDTISSEYTLIGDDIILYKSSGDMKESHVMHLFGVYEKVLKESGIAELGYHYQIADWSELGKSDMRARKSYINNFRVFFKKYHCRLYVIFGLSTFLKSVVLVSRQFFPAEVVIADDLQDALRIIEERKKISKESEIAGKAKIYSGKKVFTAQEIQGYIEELFNFMGKINWDAENFFKENYINDSHPFKSIFETVALLKWDFDVMLNEKNSLLRELEKTNRELRDVTAQLIHSEKMSALGELSGGIAHELNQPLNIISIIAQSLVRDIERGRLDAASLKDDIFSITEHVRRMTEIINHMRFLFRRSDDLPMELHDVNSIIKNSCLFVGRQLVLHNIELVQSFGEGLPQVMCDPIQLEQVIMNIIGNARDALETCDKERKNITVSTAVESGSLIISIADNGPGIDKSNIDKIFESFYTTKEAGKGTGLGLSISKKIVEAHKGRIEVKSAPGEGTVFLIILPI